MLFIFGIRDARIANFTDHDHICYPCKASDREVQVYRSYFHFCLIPVFPVGARKFIVRCNHCGDDTLLENVIEKYGAKTKTPFYFYSAWFLLTSLAVFWFYWNKYSQNEKVAIISNPAVNDVYTIRQEKNGETTYYFLKIIGISGDSIIVFHNHLDYGDFVNHLAKDDYFVKHDTIVYKRKLFKDMLENEEIFSVSRGDGDREGFNRND